MCRLTDSQKQNRQKTGISNERHLLPSANGILQNTSYGAKTIPSTLRSLFPWRFHAPIRTGSPSGG
jgi:hypothetical protein